MGTHKHFAADSDEEPEQSISVKKQATPGPRGGIRKETGRRKQSKGKKGSKSINGQIRGIERLLKHKGAGMGPGARKAKEEELNELIRVRDEHKRREKEKEMAQKYRMVKFFEKRKLQRILDSIVKKGDKAEDVEQKKQIMRDLRYIQEYPKDEKYVALFPKEGHSEKSKKKVELMRAKIEGKAGGDEGEEGREGEQGEDEFFLQDDSD